MFISMSKQVTRKGEASRFSGVRCVGIFCRNDFVSVELRSYLSATL